MHNFAPVLIPTLNRYKHFKRCVESLAECTHAEKTDLYIALDYPLNESHWDGYKKIANYVNEIKGFKAVVIIKRDKNYGAKKNVKEARKKIFKQYDRIIFSEDDNEFSPNFLDYINKGLEKFEDDENVLAVCGYVYPINIPADYQFNYFYYKTFSGWGYGMWRDRYKTFYYSPEKLVSFMNNWEYAKKAYNMAPKKPLSILNAIKNKLPLYGDGVISLENIKYDRYCVFPTLSKVRNLGHDGSGVHCKKIKTDIFLSQEIDINYEFCYSEFTPLHNSKITNLIKNYFKLKQKHKIKLIATYLQFKLNIFKKKYG